MTPIVRAENLSKQYVIGAREAAYETLRESITAAVRAPFSRLRRGNGSRPTDTIWALKNVSFDVAPGEVVGIIGRNGAGKSTLLKVLSRITEPTSGRAQLFGRVASLLEVGTGFHAELTGRENIYLNGAILGMRKAEIARKFDQIVAFAEVEKFLDTPVKRYSSGMYMRLAFAVASHLEPEILVVDEVLAVGDAEFQKKCLGKMSAVATEGRTVLFVSHNMLAVQSLCQRAIWLDGGKVIEDGPAAGVVSSYVNSALEDGGLLEETWPEMETAPGNDLFRLHRITVDREDQESSEPLTTGTPISIAVEYWNLLPDVKLHITLHMYTEQEVVAFSTGSGSGDPEWSAQPLPIGLFRSVCHIPANLLNVGRHHFKVLVIRDGTSVLYQRESAISFDIVDLKQREFGTYGREPGVVRPALRWESELLQNEPD